MKAVVTQGTLGLKRRLPMHFFACFSFSVRVLVLLSILMVVGAPTTWAQSVNITEFTVPTLLSPAIAAGPDGALWFTEPDLNKIGRITTAGVVSEYSVSGSPGGIAAGPDGALWFTEPNNTKVGRITIAGVV